MIYTVILGLWFLVGLLEVADFIRTLLYREFWQALSPGARQTFARHCVIVVPLLALLLLLAGPLFLLMDIGRWLGRKLSTSP